mgnify:FL=1
MSTKTYSDGLHSTDQMLYITKPNRRHKNGDWNDKVAPGDCSQSCALTVQDLVNKFGYERYSIMWVIANNEDIDFGKDPEGELSKKSKDELSAPGQFRHIFIYDNKTEKIIDKSQGKILFENLEVTKARYLHRYQGKYELCQLKLTDLKRICCQIDFREDKIFKYSFLNSFCGYIISVGKLMNERQITNLKLIYIVIENPDAYNHNCPPKLLKGIIRDMKKDK